MNRSTHSIEYTCQQCGERAYRHIEAMWVGICLRCVEADQALNAEDKILGRYWEKRTDEIESLQLER